MRALHYVHDDEGDWAAVYLGDNLYHEGRSIPDRVWLELLQCNVSSVDTWISDFSGTAGRAELLFQDMEPHTLREH